MSCDANLRKLSRACPSWYVFEKWTRSKRHFESFLMGTTRKRVKWQNHKFKNCDYRKTRHLWFNRTKFESSTLKKPKCSKCVNGLLGHFVHIQWAAIFVFHSVCRYVPIYPVSKKEMIRKGIFLIIVYRVHGRTNRRTTDRRKAPYHNTPRLEESVGKPDTHWMC